MLDIVARRTKASLDEICDEFFTINRKLQERTVSIEELVAQKQYMAGVPKGIQALQKKLALLEVNYDILEDFYYNMSPDDFNQKWTAIGWTQQINSQIEETSKLQERDKGRFQKELGSSM